MKRIIDYLSAAAFPPSWSCSTQIRAMLLQRSISPAIATISSTIMKRHRVYAICGAGKIDVIDQIDPKTYRVSTTIDTADGARHRTFCFGTRCLVRSCPASGLTTSGSSLLSNRMIRGSSSRVSWRAQYCDLGFYLLKQKQTDDSKSNADESRGSWKERKRSQRRP